MSDTSSTSLTRILDASARLLESGQPDQAALVLDSWTASSGDSEPAPSRESLDRARHLLERCQAAEAELRRRMLTRLAELGATQRAAAYRDDPARCRTP